MNKKGIIDTTIKYCEYCGSPMKLKIHRKMYNMETGKLRGTRYWNVCSKFLCRWSMDTTFQKVYIKEPE